MNCLECSIETTNPHYCSLSCSASAQYKNYGVCLIAYCERCGDIFRKRNNQKRFCSRRCSTIVSNTGRVRKKTGTCLRCGKEAKSKFCSSICSARFKSEEKIQSWIDGEWSGNASQGLAKCIKDHLIKDAGYKCTSPTCAVPGGFAEINPVTGRCPLEVDHLDGNCYNNVRENLMVVCPNCHALTPTYRALNKNGQRTYRRKSKDVTIVV